MWVAAMAGQDAARGGAANLYLDGQIDNGGIRANPIGPLAAVILLHFARTHDVASFKVSTNDRHFVDAQVVPRMQRSRPSSACCAADPGSTFFV
jgi:hypothetical protein